MKKSGNNHNSNLVFEELEARLLLSADPLTAIAEPGLAPLENTVQLNNEFTIIVQNHTEQSSAVTLKKAQSSNRTELVIIDSRAPNFQQLHNDVIYVQQQGRDINVVILDAHRDGLEQISEALSKYDKLDAVHLVSHGSDAQLHLGASLLNQQNLQQRSDEISKWQDVFADGGDLLIYGCNLTNTSDGVSLANSLGQLTGADVAASDDQTGNVQLGGDWDLEYTTGEIETVVAFSIDIQQSWQGTLEGATPSAAAENAASEEQRQQEQQAQEEQLQEEVEQQEAALREEEQATVTQTIEQQQAVIAEEQRQEIVFIDDSVTDFQSFIEDLQGSSNETTTFEIYLLDGDSNGVMQINDVLSEHNNVDAVHIISHSNDGAIRLGNTWLNASNLNGYSDSLNAWAGALDDKADILIYGCNLAESETGEQFVSQLAQLTGSDVAASDDNTGHSSLTGDWELEYQQGEIETSIAISSETQNSWSNVLVNFTVDTTADTPDVNPGNGVAEDGSGNTSLRSAIEEANALAGADTITIGVGTFTLSSGELTISSDIIITGAGIDQTFIDGASLSRIFNITSGTVTISDLTIQNGNASGQLGGGILNDGDLVLTNVTLADNTAKEGGGISSSASSSLTINGGSITGNSAENGGGIWIKDSVAGVTLTNVTISGNSVTKLGGGIYNEAGPMQITDCTFSGNTALEGGGVYNKKGDATLINVTLSGNTASNLGGGLSNNDGNITATNMTITANTAATGSGIHQSGGTASIQNTIVAANTGSADVNGSYISLGYNMIGDAGSASGFTDGVNNDQVGDSITPVDPLLGALADNGGSTLTHALLVGSTAIDAGTSTDAPATDQIGSARDDGFIDIGAFEYDGGAVNQVPVGLPAIMGTVTEDQILTADTSGISDADGLGTFIYQWLRDGLAIGGATSSTYTLGDADVGSQISVQVSYTDGLGTPEGPLISAQTASVVNVNDSPSGAVNIAGTPTEDQTLTASNTLADADGLGAVTYQWQRGGVDIAGATAVTYTLTDADVGTTITVVASYTDGEGTSESVSSAGVGPIANINDNPVGLPTITGTVTEDQMLTADTSGISDADGLGAFSYQWLRDGVAIGGSTASTYTLGDADVGTLISVRVDYTDVNTTPESVTSVQTAAVVNINDIPTGAVIINNSTPAEGDTLTVSNTLTDADGLSGAITYQWQRDGVDISGATASSYTTVQADVGAVITVVASYTDDRGSAENVSSAGTAVVSNVNNAPVGIPSIIGSVTQGQILTADTGSISDVDGLGIFSYQWLRDGVDISGATASTYTLGGADVGTQISVRVDYTDGYSTAESVTSAQTANVTNVNNAPVGIPNIIGTVTEDQLLTVDTSGISDADGLGAFSYQWLRDGVAIGGATSSTYTLGDNDVGRQISVRVNYIDGNSTSESITSAQTTAVTNINDNPVGLPTILGTVTEDQTLTVDTSGISDVDGLGVFSYQWLRDGVDIAGATASTYTLADLDVGTLISVAASYTDGQGTNESVTSGGVGPVANVNDTPSGAVNIAGIPTEDQTLTASNTLADADGLGAITYQWQRGGVDIAGATAASYTLTDADVGTSITVVASYTDGQGTNESVSSVGVGPIANVNDPANIGGVDTGSVTEDLDPDLDTLLETSGTLTITDVDAGEASFATGTIAGLYGDITIDAAGNWSYAADNTQAAIQNLGPADTLIDTISVGSFDGTTHNIVITIGGINDAPVAQNDSPASVNEGGVALFDLTSNDYDIDNALDLNSISIIVAPANGSLLVNGDGTVTYTHDGGETLNDSFSYTITDITGAISTVATVNITVNPVNSTPTTTGIVDVVVTEDSAATTIDLNTAFDDPDNLDSELTYTITGNTSIGLFGSTAVNAVTGELVLDYAADMNGSSQISIRATDPSGAFVDTLFTVTVTPANDAPVIATNTGILTTATNNTVITNTELNVSDIDNVNTAIIYTITALPGSGELMINGVAATIGSNFSEDDIINNRVSYQADGTSSSDQFEFSVSDGAGGTILGNKFNVVVQLAPTDTSDPIEPEITPEPEDTTTPTTSTDPVVTVSLVDPVETDNTYGSGFTTIGNNSTTEIRSEPVPDEGFEDFKNLEISLENNELEGYDLASDGGYSAMQVKSIKALFTAMDQMKQQMDEAISENKASVEFRAAVVSSSGVALTAGVVAWALRSGALMTSLMAVLPVWRGYDPLPILNYSDSEDEEENITEDKIPTSLEELIKVKVLKERLNKEKQIESLFGSSTSRELSNA